MSSQISDNPFYLSSRFAGKKLHLGIAGSVSCYKSAELLRAFLKLDIQVSATLSPGAVEFVTPLLFNSLGADPVYSEMFTGENPFDHLEPGQLADAMLIAPASANMLAKMAHGFADNMLSAQILAFAGPLLAAPAMNPRMWHNSATKANIKLLGERDVIIVPPEAGVTACGEEGQGRLAELPEIFLAALRALSPADLAGRKVLVTLGPTREAWDSVRFWTNSSSGRMGAALATAAWLRGAEVIAICGPGTDIFLPSGINGIPVTSANEMMQVAADCWPGMDIGIFCAAVADFAPDRPVDGDQIKMKKAALGGEFNLRFSANPDILATLAKQRDNGQKILGFAAEIAPDMAKLLELARLKRASKQADLLAANQINAGVFGAESGSMAVVDRCEATEIWAAKSKADIAWDLLTWLLKL